MTRWFWFDGRLSWPFVAVIVFLSLILLLADLVWRVLVIPLETLLALTIAIGVVAILSLIGVNLLLRRGRQLK